MSDLSAQQLTALGSSVMPTVLPPDVRKAGAKGEQLYQAALGFEQMLTQQLTDQLAADDAGHRRHGRLRRLLELRQLGRSVEPVDLPDRLELLVDGRARCCRRRSPTASPQAGGLGIAHQLYLLLAQQTGLTAATGSAGSASGAAVAPSAASGGTAGGGQ